MAIDLFGHITQHQHNLVGGIESGVGIVTHARLARDGKAVAAKNHLGLQFVIGGKRSGAKILAQLKFRFFAVLADDDQFVFALLQFHAKLDIHLMRVFAILTGGLEAKLFHLRNDVVARLLNALGGRVASFKFIRRDDFNLLTNLNLSDGRR